METVNANNCKPKPGDRKPLKVQQFTGCVCKFARVRCEPSPGMVFVECANCGATQRIEFYAEATPCYRGKNRKGQR